jgi:hypothetical protein
MQVIDQWLGVVYLVFVRIARLFGGVWTVGGSVRLLWRSTLEISLPFISKHGQNDVTGDVESD